MEPTSNNCPITPGTVIAEKYRVERIIGIGGMGVVVAARHLELDDRVAIKFLLPHALGNAEIVGRFAREARAAVKIKGQHVARTLDVGRTEDGSPYIVMEYLEGVDLSTQLRTQGPLSIESAVTFTLQTCEALADAHAIGIIHRDLKPANLFLARASDGAPCLKVLDFGISKLTRSGDSAGLFVTNTAAMMGTPVYMAPEQMVSARSVDARCDIWSLGVTLFELLTAERPFVGENVAQLCTRVATEPPSGLCARRPEVPRGLELVVLRCLEKDRERRYGSVAELAMALRPFAPSEAHGSIGRISRVLANAGVSVPDSEVEPSTGRNDQVTTSIDPTVASVVKMKHRSRRRRHGLVALTVVTAALAAFGVWMQWLSGTSPRLSAESQAQAVGAGTLPGLLPPMSTSTERTSTGAAQVVPLPNPPSSTFEVLAKLPPQKAPKRDPSRQAPSMQRGKAELSSAAPAPTTQPEKPGQTRPLPNLGGDGREY